MSKETQAPDSGAQSAGASAEALALSLHGASRASADAFLDDQRAMLHLQMAEMRARNPYEVSHFRLRRFSGWARAALELSLGLIGLALVAGLGVMVWNAAHADGYVIESFTVPPDMAARGLTGEVVAGRLLDRLNVVTTPPPNTVRVAQNLSASSADNVKVEIPQTGISLGELYRFLRRWLGSENHVSGEVVRQDSGVAVAVRVNGRDGASYQGPEAALDGLLLKAAEHVYDIVRPGGYVTYLMTQDPPREAEGEAVRQRVIADPRTPPDQRAGAWNGLGVQAMNRGEMRQSLLLLRRGQEAYPASPLPYSNAVNGRMALSQPEAALALLPQARTVFEKGHDDYTADAVISIRSLLDTTDADVRGDHARAVAGLQAAVAALGGGYRQYAAILSFAEDRARLHDGAALAWLADQPRPASLPANIRRGLFVTPFRMQAVLQHWPQVIAQAGEIEKVLPQWGLSEAGRELFRAVQLRPLLALAKAKTGDIAEAERLIAQTPGDCYDCVRARGMIASEAKQWGRADYWFAGAVADAPSIPMAHEDWGRSLLARGKVDEAIAQFALSNKKGPHFADALQGWGEALMAKNQSHLAVAKFAEAEKYAPNWGRLHLKWGQALAYAGKPDDAKAHFARAAGLDLTPSEKAQLKTWTQKTGDRT